MNINRVCASSVLSTTDLEVRPDGDLTEMVARFLAVGEAVVAHWIEYARGLLLFVMAPGDDGSGEFYLYDRKNGRFWLLTLVDTGCGGYSVSQMRQKIREFRLLDFAEDPALLGAARQPADSL